MTSAAVERLASRLIGLEKQVRGLSQPQLAYSTIEGGAVDVRDDEGNLTGVVGTFPDGTGGSISVNGPRPPVPSAPTLEPIPGGLLVRWDGTFVGGEVAPFTFSRVEVHVGDVAGFYNGSALTQRGTIETARGGEVSVVPLMAQPRYVVLVAWTAAGIPSFASAEVSATPLTVVSDADLAAVETTANNAVGTANNAQLVADRAEGKADTAQADASAAITTANGKGRAYYQAAAPTGSLTIHDVWFDTDADNAPHRWDGTAWIAQPFGNLAVGNLDAAKIATGFLAAARIASDSIIARHILAGEIKTGHIAANQILAGHILAGEIKADHIAAGAITANKLTADAIDGKTITGATVRTASTGTRVEMGPSSFYDNAAATMYYDPEGRQAGIIRGLNNGAAIISGFDNLGYSMVEVRPTGAVDFVTYATDGSGGRQYQFNAHFADIYPVIRPFGGIGMHDRTIHFRGEGDHNHKIHYAGTRDGPRIWGNLGVEVFIVGYSTTGVVAYANSSGEWRVATRVYANGVQLSSRRENKANVRTNDVGLAALRQLKPRAYERVKDAHGEDLPAPKSERGFIVDEVAPVMPEVVGTDAETGEQDSIDVMGMLTVVVQALQELDAKVNPAAPRGKE